MQTHWSNSNLTYQFEEKGWKSAVEARETVLIWSERQFPDDDDSSWSILYGCLMRWVRSDSIASGMVWGYLMLMWSAQLHDSDRWYGDTVKSDALSPPWRNNFHRRSRWQIIGNREVRRRQEQNITDAVFYFFFSIAIANSNPTE